MKARIAVVGLGALMSTVGFGVMAPSHAALINIPAPPSSSDAVAVQVGKIASVGQTGADAGTTSSASAAPVSIGGQPLLSGTKATTKTASGSLLDTGETQLGRVAVLPWSTEVGQNQAGSNSAVATAKLNNIGDVAVAPSSSFAIWTPGKSSARSVSDGAVVHLGDFTIKVLHSESGAPGFGKTYLVQLLGKEIGRTDANGCMLDVGPVANVGCLQSLAGVGSDASVAQALISKSPLGKVVAAAATGGVGTTANGPTSVLNNDIGRGGSHLLARTGTSILLMFAVGLLLAVAGATALQATRKPALVAATSR